MDVYYHPKYNIDLGLLNYLHPFDGCKFKHVYESIKHLSGMKIIAPAESVSNDRIEPTQNELLQRLVKTKRYILGALGVPNIPLLPMSVIDNRVLLPMRWGVAGTLAAMLTCLHCKADSMPCMPILDWLM